MATNPNLERMNIGKPAPPRTQKKEKMGGQEGVASNRERPPLLKQKGRGQRDREREGGEKREGKRERERERC